MNTPLLNAILQGLKINWKIESIIDAFNLDRLSRSDKTNLQLVLSIHNTQSLKSIKMTLDDILVKVQQETALQQKLEALLSELNVQLKTALENGDQVKIQQISNTLDQNIQSLTAAVSEATPPSPAATEVPATPVQ
jgi:hypothetical protein